MEYTVQKLAQMSGISGRTLRYYDQIGLLKPARVNSSGYRIYGRKEVDLLQQILFYRELDLHLDVIKRLIHQPDVDQTEALKHHYKHLMRKRDRLEKILKTMRKTINSYEGGLNMTDKEKFEGLKDQLIAENEAKYGNEIRNKYGHETVEASNTKLKGMSEKDYNAMQALELELVSLLKEAISIGDPASDVAQQLARKHKEWLMYSWPRYSHEAHAGLVEMYVQDERFRDYYDQRVKGGAAFLREAVLTYISKI
ncbi:MerR family transcriptional regulator [Halalkalibacter sp. APA_J-10(15)]|uniref:MerR family transcriptional regulator n=1 Tax=Halalkalibacter sp. APA_J-10(15) TaxID=2933805 RepID=UPI001FF1A5EE|nr:MerR family transcriptional regulator [Halalkalibacter sp. APA_J-10(15)]MCK0471685.1 MerR family transcriptional regulator [Halalkalibacter sp. APA_J-10(15)]